LDKKEELLIEASRNGQINQVKKLLDWWKLGKPNINVTGFQGRTPLIMAVAEGHTEVVQLLVRKGANIFVQDMNGDSVLNYAIWGGNAEIVEIFLKSGIDIGLIDNEGNNALMLASLHCEPDIVKLLLKYGSNINKKNKHGNPPLFLAVRSCKCRRGFDHDKLGTIEILLSAGANVKELNNSGENVLMFAAKYGIDSNCIAIIKLLINKGADVNVRCNGVSLIEQLIPHYNFEPYYSEHYQEIIMPEPREISDNEYEVIQLLLDNGADIGFALAKAVSSKANNINRVIELLEKTFDERNTNKKASQPDEKLIYLYIKEGKSHEAKELIDGLSDINIIDDEGKTLLIHAAAKGYLDIVKHLIKLGCNINVKDKWGLTALNHATSNGYKMTADMLKQNGAV
jgi:ankyrin repeat protein